MLSQAAKRDYKRLTIDIEAEKYRRRSEALITSDEGIETRINRHTYRPRARSPS